MFGMVVLTHTEDLLELRATLIVKVVLGRQQPLGSQMLVVI